MMSKQKNAIPLLVPVAFNNCLLDQHEWSFWFELQQLYRLWNQLLWVSVFTSQLETLSVAIIKLTYWSADYCVWPPCTVPPADTVCRSPSELIAWITAILGGGEKPSVVE